MSALCNYNSSASKFSLDSIAQNTNDIWILMGRIALGGIFVVSGFGKLTHLGGFEASLALKGIPLPWLAASVGAPVEFFGGLAIVLGLAGRYAALLMIGFTVVATLISHRYWEYSDAAVRQAQLNNFSKNIAIMGGAFLRSSRMAPDASRLIAFGGVHDRRIKYNPFRRGRRGLYPVRF